MKALALVVACVATGALLAGCSSASKPTNKDDSAFTYLFDRKSNWTENKVDSLPPLPQQANLLPFDVSGNTPLTFAVDSKSLSVGDDGVVRYTVVVKSPSGAYNVNYEGIRCDTYEWRQYAGLNADHDGWDRQRRHAFRADRKRHTERLSGVALSGLLLHEQNADRQRQADSGEHPLQAYREFADTLRLRAALQGPALDKTSRYAKEKSRSGHMPGTAFLTC